MNRKHSREQPGRHAEFEFLARQLGKRLRADCALCSCAYKYVYPPVETRGRLRHARNRGIVACITPFVVHLVRDVAQCFERPLTARFRSAIKDDRRTALGELAGDDQPDAAGPACHQGNPARQVLGGHAGSPSAIAVGVRLNRGAGAGWSTPCRRTYVARSTMCGWAAASSSVRTG